MPLIFSSPHVFITHLSSTSHISTAPATFNQPLITCFASSSKFATLSNPSHPQGKVIEDNLVKLRQKVEGLGINCSSCIPGVYTYLNCPKCQGGPLLERSLSFHIIQSGESVLWRCFNLECCWAGQMYADDGIQLSRINQQGRIAPQKRLSEGTVRLQPLGDELIAYFAKRMISKETLEKNHVMQRAGDQDFSTYPNTSSIRTPPRNLTILPLLSYEEENYNPDVLRKRDSWSCRKSSNRTTLIKLPSR